ncbi:hypothetical protein TGCAST_387950, partial [Toxoplasma gondii CAST]
MQGKTEKADEKSGETESETQSAGRMGYEKKKFDEATQRG